MLRTYTDYSSFDKIPDNQKESYYPSKDECDELKYEDWAASLFVFHKFIRRNVTYVISYANYVKCIYSYNTQVCSNFAATLQYYCNITETLQCCCDIAGMICVT